MMIRQKGFTLIESVMVIVILMILTASAISIFKGQNVFYERFLTDEVKQMLYYARKMAMTTECDVEIAHRNGTITLLQREHCQTGEFTHPLPGNSLLDNAAQYRILIPKNINFSGEFPVYINKAGMMYIHESEMPKKMAWTINNKILHIDPLSGFAYESK